MSVCFLMLGFVPLAASDACMCPSNNPYCAPDDHYCYANADKSGGYSWTYCFGSCTSDASTTTTTTRTTTTTTTTTQTCECGEQYPYCNSNGNCYMSEDSYQWCGWPGAGCCNEGSAPACTSDYVPPTCTCGPRFPYCEDGQCRSHAKCIRHVVLDREVGVCTHESPCEPGDPRCGSDIHGNYGSSEGDRCNETGKRRLPQELPWAATGLTCTANYADTTWTTPPTPPTGNCHDEASCNSTETCHVEFRNPVGTVSSETDKTAVCDFPDIRTGCCDHFTAVVFCNLLGANSPIADCLNSTMSGFGHGEWQWRQAQSDGGMRTPHSMCPDTWDIQRNYRTRMIQHCRDADGNILATTTTSTTTTTPPPPAGNCHDEASCVANEICHVQLGPTSCDFPDVCVGLCDYFRLVSYCQTLGHCIYGNDFRCDECMQRAAHAGFTSGEVQWREAWPSLPPIDWCPGLRSRMGSQQQMMSHCQVPNGTVFASQWEEFAIMTAQEPQQELRRNQSPIVAVGALAIVATLMTSIIAIKKKSKPEDLYTSLVEGAA